MMRIFALLMGLVAMLALVRADEIFDQANADFTAGRFPAAAQGYEKLLERDGARVAVLQNLGSAYFRMEDMGRAILAFERGLVLEPGNADLRANLKLARDEAGVIQAEDRGWRFARLLTVRQWSWLALLAMVAMPLGLIGSWVFGRAFLVRNAGGRVVLSLWLLIPGTVARQSLRAMKDYEDGGRKGLVVEKVGVVRLSPFETAESRSELKAGREVILGDEKNGYHWVSVEGGVIEGWVAAGEVEPLIPVAKTVE